MDENPPQPFQFRLQDLFATIGATAVALTLLRLSIWLVKVEQACPPALGHLSVLATFMAFGAAIGFLFRRPWNVAIAFGVPYLPIALLAEFGGSSVRE
jgi:hypothetical protein